MITCDEALEMMLEAEPAELAGQGSSAVAIHLGECARCGAVAMRLLADTRALRETVAAAPGDSRAFARGGRRVTRPVVVASALAAAAALIFVLPRKAEVPGVPGVPVATARSTPDARSSATAAARASSVAPASRALTESPAIAARRFADPVAATPVRFVASQPVTTAEVATPVAVSVTPPPGVRAAVLRTKDPGITVVWLY